jgi:hypothetical protein
MVPRRQSAGGHRERRPRARLQARRCRPSAEHPRRKQTYVSPRCVTSPRRSAARTKRASASCRKSCGYSGVFGTPVHRSASQRHRSRAHPRRDQQDPSRDFSDSLACLGPPKAIHRGPGPRTGAQPDTTSVEDARPREDPAASGRLRSPPWSGKLRALGPGKSSACFVDNRVAKLGRRARRLQSFRRSDSRARQRAGIRRRRARRTGEGFVRG